MSCDQGGSDRVLSSRGFVLTVTDKRPARTMFSKFSAHRRTRRGNKNRGSLTGGSIFHHNGDVSSKGKCGSFEDTYVLGIRYDRPPVHMSFADPRVVRTVGVTLLTRIVWYRGKAKISRLLGNAPPETHTTHKPTIPIPHELVEMIIAHLIYDLRALKACSLTCYSWYIAAVPHLHHTITFRENNIGIARVELKPLSKLHELGISPLVREVRVRQLNRLRPWFMPQAFSRRDLRCFSAFTNVQKLRLEKLDIFSFIPEVERYFGQFSATLRSIALFAPRCSPRQLSHFLSLFSNLDDVEIRGFYPPPRLPGDPILVPISAPKLRGQLIVSSFREVETWKDLIAACDGLRFYAMDLRNVADCAPLLLEACSETLETLRFFPVDAIGKWFRRMFVHGVELMANSARSPVITLQLRSITTQGPSVSTSQNSGNLSWAQRR